MIATSSLISPSTQQLNWQFPLVQAEFCTHRLPGVPNTMAESNSWLALSFDRKILLYHLQQPNWPQSRREITLSFVPQYLLFAGMDNRYLIAINTIGYYEVYDRVSLEPCHYGQFAHHCQDSQYQTLHQQYLLATSGSNLYLYPIAAINSPIAKSTVYGKIMATAFHLPSQTLYCASQLDQTLHLTLIQMGQPLTKSGITVSYPLQFVGLSSADDRLLLQGFSPDGQLRVMVFELPDLRLVSQQEKSLAYQGTTCLHPTQPWAATDLEMGLLVWDTQMSDPLALLQFRPPMEIPALSWLDSGQLLFIHGTTIELWTFKLTETPFLNAYQEDTIAALQDFQQWIYLQRERPGVAYFVGTSSIALAFVEHNADSLYFALSETSTSREIYTLLNSDDRQIFLDGADRLSPDMVRQLHQRAIEQGISLILITQNPPEINVPGYHLRPITEQINLTDVSAYFAPPKGRYRQYLNQIKPTLEASARRRMMQIINV